MIQFFKKTIYFITILSISLFNVSNLNAQEYTVSGQGTTNPLDVQTRGLNELIEKVNEEIKDVTNGKPVSKLNSTVLLSQRPQIMV